LIRFFSKELIIKYTKMEINRILVPTDFSIDAENALNVAIEICEHQQARLTLLHVVDDFSFFNPSAFTTTNLMSDIIETMEDKMRDFVQYLSDTTNLQIDGIIETGNPADNINRFATKESLDMIVMGKRGISGISESFIGLTAFRVIKQSRCPVLTIPCFWEKKYFEKILYPVRLLPDALDKYNYVEPIIEIDNSHFLIAGLVNPVKPDNVSDLMILIDKIKLRLNDENLIFSSKLLQSKDFASTILAESESYNADLVVITADIDTEWKDLLAGPFAQQIVNHSKRPVLSIRPGLR
jgi:nucleotide-binding universal stress UspA family protein